MLPNATGFYLPRRFQGPRALHYLKWWNPLVRFSSYCVIKACISFLDLGAEIGMSSALVARTPGVRITAVEPNAQLRNVLRKNFASISPLRFDVSLPPWSSPHSPCSISDIMESVVYAKFVVGTIKEVAAEVIRISGSHVVKFLPLICRPSSTRYIVVKMPCVTDPCPFFRMIELLQLNRWKITQLPPTKRGAPVKYVRPRRTTFVAEQT